jgi:hypothetical protein
MLSTLHFIRLFESINLQIHITLSTQVIMSFPATDRDMVRQ